MCVNGPVGASLEATDAGLVLRLTPTTPSGAARHTLVGVLLGRRLGSEVQEDVVALEVVVRDVVCVQVADDLYDPLEDGKVQGQLGEKAARRRGGNLTPTVKFIATNEFFKDVAKINPQYFAVISDP